VYFGTDNGAIFLKKAFRQFGVAVNVDNGTEQHDNDGDDTDADELSFDNLHAVLDAKSSNSETSVIVLSPHHACSSHTLSLLAVNYIHEEL